MEQSLPSTEFAPTNTEAAERWKTLQETIKEIRVRMRCRAAQMANVRPEGALGTLYGGLDKNDQEERERLHRQLVALRKQIPSVRDRSSWHKMKEIRKLKHKREFHKANRMRGNNAQDSAA